MANDSYAELGLEPGATEAAIREAYAGILGVIRHGKQSPHVAQARIQAARKAYKSLTSSSAKALPRQSSDTRTDIARSNPSRIRYGARADVSSSHGQWIGKPLLLLACLIALGAFVYQFFDLGGTSQDERAFNQALKSVAEQEHRVTADMGRLQTSAATMTPQEISEQLHNDIAPQWDRLYDLMASTHVSEDSKHYALHQAMLKFLDDHRKMTRLIADGIAQNNADLIAQANVLREDAKVQSTSIQWLIEN